MATGNEPNGKRIAKTFWYLRFTNNPILLRNALCILLLACLAAPALITGGWLQWRKAAIRTEVKRLIAAGLDRESLTLLTFTGEEARALPGRVRDREFEYRGEMFDIVETRQAGDTLFLYCWRDYAETELNRQLAQLVAGTSQNDPQQAEKREHLSDFYESLYHNAPPVWRVVVPPVFAGQGFHVQKTGWPTVFLAPPTPPPERG